jgi:hypothetical protein
MIAMLTDNIVIAPERRLVGDAESLLAVAAWADLPAGIALLPATRGDVGGLSVGSGHLLAVAHELPPGAVAVQVDARGILRLSFAEAIENPEVGLKVARQFIEHVAIHEAAHALVAPLDPAASATEAKAIVAARVAGPTNDEAACHHPRWAAALVILSRRIVGLRPAAERAARERVARADVGHYGLDADAIDAALGEVDADCSLRELLAPGGAVADRVAAACPAVAERRAYIEHRWPHGAAGEAGSISSKESERAE